MDEFRFIMKTHLWHLAYETITFVAFSFSVYSITLVTSLLFLAPLLVFTPYLFMCCVHFEYPIFFLELPVLNLLHFLQVNISSAKRIVFSNSLQVFYFSLYLFF